MNTAQKIDVHGLSVPGDGRDKNHDHFAIATLSKSMRLHQSNLTIDDDSRVHGQNQGHLFLVADGISDDKAPARASSTAVDSVVKYFLNEMPWYHLADGEPEEVTLALEDALKNAQDELLRSVSDAKHGLGTTMTLAFVFWPDLYIAHVGDSRCYLSRNGDLRQLTTDHALEESAHAPGNRIEPRNAKAFWSGRGGLSQKLHPDVRHVQLEPGDKLALVTDGVTQEQFRPKLKALLKCDASAEQVCDNLVDGTGKDDRTAIVVRFLPLEDIRATEHRMPAPSDLTARHDMPKNKRRTTPTRTVKRKGIPVPKKPGTYRMAQ